MGILHQACLHSVITTHDDWKTLRWHPIFIIEHGLVELHGMSRQTHRMLSIISKQPHRSSTALARPGIPPGAGWLDSVAAVAAQKSRSPEGGSAQAGHCRGAYASTLPNLQDTLQQEFFHACCPAYSRFANHVIMRLMILLIVMPVASQENAKQCSLCCTS